MSAAVSSLSSVLSAPPTAVSEPEARTVCGCSAMCSVTCFGDSAPCEPGAGNPDSCDPEGGASDAGDPDAGDPSSFDTGPGETGCGVSGRDSLTPIAEASLASTGGRNISMVSTSSGFICDNVFPRVGSAAVFAGSSSAFSDVSDAGPAAG